MRRGRAGPASVEHQARTYVASSCASRWCARRRDVAAREHPAESRRVPRHGDALVDATSTAMSW